MLIIFVGLCAIVQNSVPKVNKKIRVGPIRCSEPFRRLNWSLATYPQGVSLGLHHARSAFFTTVRSRFFTAGFSPLFTRPKAVKKLDFEFWILDIQIRRHVPQGGVLGGRINEKPPGVAEDGSLARARESGRQHIGRGERAIARVAPVTGIRGNEAP